MTRSRNWVFTLSGKDGQAIITKQGKGNELNNVTFLQLCDNNGLIVMKNLVRGSAIRKMFSVVNVEPVLSPKTIRDSMGEVTFSYGSLLNKHQKKIANKSTNYIETVKEFAKTTLIPEHHSQFETVYNIIANADTVDTGILTVLEDLPLHRNFIKPAVRRYKLKNSNLEYKQINDKNKDIVLYDWQLELQKELKTDPDPRKILWYFDLIGNTGKTYFAKLTYQLDKFTAVVQGGQAKDIYHIISKRDNDTKTVILDMSRSSQYLIDYNLIENVKNGYFQSGKYNSTMTIMPIPHIVVFANFRPNINKLSLDRWDVRGLSKKDKKIIVYKYDRKELRKMKKKNTSTISSTNCGDDYDHCYDN